MSCENGIDGPSVTICLMSQRPLSIFLFAPDVDTLVGASRKEDVLSGVGLEAEDFLFMRLQL